MRQASYVVEREEFCELVLFNVKGQEVGRARFDKCHRSKVEPLLWNLHHSGAPRNQSHRRFLHQVVLPARAGFEVDHIDGDRLNNLGSNLRYATHAQNGKNLKLSKRNKSGHRGVWWDHKNKAWQVKICVDGKQLFLGRFKDLQEAVRVRRAAEQVHYGEFTRIRVV